MKLKFLLQLFLAGIFFVQPAWTQSVDFNNYQSIKSVGTLPKEFSKTFDYQKKTSNNSYSSRKHKTEPLSTHYLDDLMHSGDVVYNDPIGEYLNKIMRVVLDANGVDDEVRVYLLKSDDANAFAFQKDVILITMGLIAQASTEAELAFILCHEYVHYRDKHIEVEYNENVRIAKEERRTKRHTQDEVAYLKSRYSKDLELKADAGGLELFLKTPYHTDAVSTTFDVLRFSNLPFDEEEFSLSFLESSYLKINEKYFLKDVAPVTIDPEKEKEDSKYSSHPDIETRRTAILTKLDEYSSGGDKDFVVSENDFYMYRKMCRFEVCRLQLLYQEYAEAFYSAFLLLRDDPNSVYLKRMATRALYGLTTYANANKLSKVLTETKKIAGNSQRVYYLFNEAKKKEINYIALNYAWRAHLQFPDDADLKAVCDELIMQAVNKNGLTPYYLKNVLPDTTIQQTTTTDKDSATVDTSSQMNDKKNNKYSKIKTVTVHKDDKGNKTIKKDAFDYIQYAFIDLADNQELKDRIKYFYDRKQQEEEDEEDDIKNKKKNVKVLDATRPQISEVVFVEPQKILVDTRPKATRSVTFTSGNDKVALYSSVHHISSNMGVKDNIVDRYQISKEGVNDLNEFGLMLDFVAEQARHANKIVMLPTDYIELKSVQDKYGTPYIGLIGVVSFKSSSRTGKVLSNVFMPVLYWFALPYGIYRAAQPSYVTYIFAEVYDLETGKRAYTNVMEYTMKAHSDVVNGGLYDLLQEIRNKK